MNCPHCEKVIDEHEANRCLDAWVAEAMMDKPTRHNAKHWMGWHWVTKDGMRVRWYSTSIAAAWEVMGRAEIHTIRQVASQEDDGEAEWAAIKYLDPLTHGVAISAPLAICRAALKAVYVGEDENGSRD